MMTCYMQASGSRNQVRRRKRERKRDKPLQSMYHQQTEEAADIQKNIQRLEIVGLKDSTEALTIAAQEQSSWHKWSAWHTGTSVLATGWKCQGQTQ